MKYKLETIPVWDAVEQQKSDAEASQDRTVRSRCFLCSLMEDAEQRYIDYYLGSSVMNPETRVQVNSRGFCPNHYLALTKAQKPQALALIAHTHLIETRKAAAPFLRRLRKLRKLKKLQSGKNGGRNSETAESVTTGAEHAASRSIVPDRLARFLSGLSGRTKRTKRIIAALRSSLEHREEGCLICESMQKTLNRYMFTFIHLWATDSDFRKAYAESGGICLHHFPQVLEMASRVLPPDEMDDFIASVSADLEKRMDAAADEVYWMTQLFKHEHAGKDWSKYKQAHARAVQLETGTVRISPQQNKGGHHS